MQPHPYGIVLSTNPALSIPARMVQDGREWTSSLRNQSCNHMAAVEQKIDKPRLRAEDWALAALDVIRDQPERRVRLQSNVVRLVAGAKDLGYEVLPTDSAVIGVVIGDARPCLDVAASLRRARVWAPAIRPPSVPVGRARLRLTLMATHEERHLDWALEALAEARSLVPC